MNRKQKIIVSVTGLFLVLLILMGLTYAYFLTRITGNDKEKSIGISTANLALVYGDDDGSIIGENEVIEPGVTFETKTFSVTNVGNAKTDYVVLIEILEGTSTFESNDFIYTLECKSYETEDYRTNGANATEVGTCNGVKDEMLPITEKESVLIGNSINVGMIQVYSFELTYKDTGIDQSADMNKILNGKLNINNISSVIPYSNPSTLTYNILKNSIVRANGTIYSPTPITTPAKGSGNMVYTGYTDPTSFSSTSGYKANWYVYGSEITIDKDGYFKIINPQVGKFSSVATSMIDGYITTYSGYNSENAATAVMNNEFSTVYKVGSSTTTSTLYYKEVTKTYENSETILSITQDDYGDSYYYRGGVTDNYVNFAGMCWRIVRIEGDGSVKLILEDYYAECDDTLTNDKNNDNIVYTGDFAIKTTVNYGYTKSSGTNSQYKINYLNYLGGLADAFESFQTSISSYTSKLKVGNWCYDNTAYQDRMGLVPIIDTSSYYSNNTMFYYGTFIRLYVKKESSLTCKGTKMTEFRTGNAMYVGTLTADEVAYAGGNTETYNTNYYLTDNPGAWWTLSPEFYSSNQKYDLAYEITNYGLINSLAVSLSFYVNTDVKPRPAVSLISGTEITGGDGTISNPYNIQ